jgi:hypothetical protein
MSLKAELEAWAAALKAYDEEDFQQSLDIFSVRSRSFLPSFSSHLLPRASPTRQKFLQIWVLSMLLSASMKLPWSSSSPPPSSTNTLPSRQSRPPPLFFSPSTNSSYFQCGVSNFLLGRYDRSSSDFESALLYLRGNESMYVASMVASSLFTKTISSNYTQLGLAFTLFSAEVLFNKGEPLSSSSLFS